jgi:serine/threonine protein kinase
MLHPHFDIILDEMSSLKPGAESRRFKACNVHVIPADYISAELQRAEDLEMVANFLQSSGLVQVDKNNRVFRVHQLLQQAVGFELGLQHHCKLLRELLHSRFGQFGDESYIDIRLYKVMREAVYTGIVAVQRVVRENMIVEEPWCSGMLLRLYDIARRVHGDNVNILKYAHKAARSSLAAAQSIQSVHPDISNVSRISGAYGHQLRKIRWQWHVLTCDAERTDLLVSEVTDAYNSAVDIIDIWEISTSLGSAYYSASLYYDSMGMREKAIAALEYAVHIRMDVLGGDHPDTAAALATMGTFFIEADEWDDKRHMAICFQKRALRCFKHTLGLHPATAAIMVNMGSSCFRDHRLSMSIRLFKNALDIYERTVGRKHPDAALTMSRISLTYFHADDFKAADFAEEAFNICNETLDSNHKTFVECRNILSCVQQTFNRSQIALKTNVTYSRMTLQSKKMEAGFTIHPILKKYYVTQKVFSIYCHKLAKQKQIAFDRVTGKEYVIIEMSFDDDDSVDIRRLLKEIKLLKFFRHENIVSIRNVILYPEEKNFFNRVYVALSLSSLETNLAKLISSRQQLTDDHCQYFMYQIVRGLYYIHSADVIHANLTPENLLVRSNCDLKIFNFFGAVVHGHEAVDAEDADCDDLRTPDQYIIQYRCPEFFLGFRNRLTSAADMWSVGCILAELYNRRALFDGCRDGTDIMQEFFGVVGVPEPDETRHLSERASTFIHQGHRRSSQRIPVRSPEQIWQSVCPHASETAIDLLSKLLLFDPKKRLTAQQALDHPYFGFLHDPEDEPSSSRTFFEDGSFSVNDCRTSVWEIFKHFQQKDAQILPKLEPNAKSGL